MSQRTVSPVWYSAAIAAACSSVLAIWGYAFWTTPAVPIDDAFVFARYASMLGRHGVLEWNVADASATDAYTSLLHQLLVAGVHITALEDPVSAAWWTSVAAGSLTPLATLWIATSVAIALGVNRWVALAAGWGASVSGAAACAGLTYWSHAMMDTPTAALVVVLGSWALARVVADPTLGRRGSVVSGALMGCVVLVRPEGMFAMFLAAAVGLPAMYRVFDDPVRRRLGYQAFGICVGIGALSFAWHLLRYGHALPNPVYVKAMPIAWDTLVEGIDYVWRGPGSGENPGYFSYVRDGELVELAGAELLARVNGPTPLWVLRLGVGVPLLLFGLLSVGRAWRSEGARAWVFGLGLLPVFWLGGVLASGGESLHAVWRFVVPVLPALGALAAAGALGLARPRGRGAALTVVVMVAGVQLAAALLRPPLDAAALERWPATRLRYGWTPDTARDDSQTADALRAVLPPGGSVAQSDYLRLAAQGADLRVVDLSGLANPSLAHAPHPPGMRRLSTCAAILSEAPDVLIYGSRVGASAEPLHDAHPSDPRVCGRLHPWPCEGSPAEFSRVVREYELGDLRLESGRLLGVLLRRSTAFRSPALLHHQTGEVSTLAPRAGDYLLQSTEWFSPTESARAFSIEGQAADRIALRFESRLWIARFAEDVGWVLHLDDTPDRTGFIVATPGGLEGCVAGTWFAADRQLPDADASEP